MVTARSDVPAYLQDRLARHGPAVDRLLQELRAKEGEMGSHSVTTAIAFDAADLVWAVLTELRLPLGSAFPIRGIRNHVAEAIIDVLENSDVRAQDAEVALRGPGSAAR